MLLSKAIYNEEKMKLYKINKWLNVQSKSILDTFIYR